MITRKQVEEMNEKELQNICIKFFIYKGVTAYIVEDFNGSFNEYNCFTFYNGNKIKYIANPDYVANIKNDLDTYQEYVMKELINKVFTIEDLQTFDNYKDYDKKVSCIINILPQMFNGVSVYNDIKLPYRFCSHTYAREEDKNTIKNLYINLNKEFNKRLLTDDDLFIKAVKYEMYNHETPYDWDGYEPALDALGLSWDTMSQHHKDLTDKVYSEIVNNGNW